MSPPGIAADTSPEHAAAQEAAAAISSGAWDRYLVLVSGAIKARREQINRDRRSP